LAGERAGALLPLGEGDRGLRLFGVEVEVEDGGGLLEPALAEAFTIRREQRGSRVHWSAPGVRVGKPRPRRSSYPGDAAATTGMDPTSGHPPSCWRASFFACCIASASLPGSLPPAWAMLGLPPPLPPTIFATSPTSLPAWSPFFVRSSVMAASSCT